MRILGARRYEGEWAKGKMHGAGTMYTAKGKVIHAGQWRNDEPVVDDDDTASVAGSEA